MPGCGMKYETKADACGTSLFRIDLNSGKLLVAGVNASRNLVWAND